MRQLLIALVMLFPLTASAFSIQEETAPFGLYVCTDIDPTRCVLLLQTGEVITRQAPVGRRAINWDMQNWQWAKDNVMALPDGAEKQSWEQDAVYWQTRLLADKAYTKLAASPLPPAFVSREGVEKYRQRYIEAARLILIMEEFFGLPNNPPVGQ